jgi:hypothetical protein
LAGRCGENARNRVCRPTTDMCTTQGQAAFGHNVQAIITYSNFVKTFSNRYRWTRLFNARRTHLLRSSNTHYVNCCNYRIVPAKLSRNAKQHSSNSAHLMRRFVPGLVDMCLPILHSYCFLSLIPDVRHAWGGCGWHKHIIKHSKHHRQRDASLTAKLDLAPPLSRSPSHAYNVQCLSKPASCAFLRACFPNTSPVHAFQLPA